LVILSRPAANKAHQHMRSHRRVSHGFPSFSFQSARSPRAWLFRFRLPPPSLPWPDCTLSRLGRDLRSPSRPVRDPVDSDHPGRCVCTRVCTCTHPVARRGSRRSDPTEILLSPRNFDRFHGPCLFPRISSKRCASVCPNTFAAPSRLRWDLSVPYHCKPLASNLADCPSKEESTRAPKCQQRACPSHGEREHGRCHCRWM
jgi:hypothetical protein